MPVSPPFVVIDTSVFVSWFLRDDPTTYSLDVLNHFEQNQFNIRAPMLLADEALNAFLRLRNINRISEQQYQILLREFENIYSEINWYNPVSTWEVIREKENLCRQYRLRTYDVNYLYLAITEGVKLATRDQRLQEAAQISGVFYAV